MEFIRIIKEGRRLYWEIMLKSLGKYKYCKNTQIYNVTKTIKSRTSLKFKKFLILLRIITFWLLYFFIYLWGIYSFKKCLILLIIIIKLFDK